jgi:outer membrane protein OmpA-like peptidoglycan-associated protein
MNKPPSKLARGAATFRAPALLSLVSALGLAGCTTPGYVGMHGCPPKAPEPSYVVLISSPDGSVGKVVIAGQKGERVLADVNQAGGTDGTAIKVDEQKIKKDFAEARGARPMIPVRQQLQFSSGSTLTPASDALISEIIAEANARPAVDITVIGHTDTLQSEQYNYDLALKRANAVAALLKARGLKANSLTVESYGEKSLLVPTPDNTYEPRNRRCEVSIR